MNDLPAVRPSFPDPDFSRSPFIVIWEITRACGLACIHCRAEAIPWRHADELTTDEGLRLIETIREFGKPLFVITGGDPLERRDIFQFVEHAAKIGLRCAVTPSATPKLTRQAISELSRSGMTRIAISLDGSSASVHDLFRQQPGSYVLTLRAMRDARELGIPLQINTTVTRYNLDDLGAIADLIEAFGVALWSVFFLVPTGRGQVRDLITPEDHERVLHRLYDIASSGRLPVKVTAAPHYRRVVIERRKAEMNARDPDAHREDDAPESLARFRSNFAFSDGIKMSKHGVNDGDGFCFISHTGDVYPDGFLPVKGGNVRERSLVDIYRHDPLFLDLRDKPKLGGKCGLCEYKVVCGGSRARSFAMTGDMLAEDPLCVYVSKQARAKGFTVPRLEDFLPEGREPDSAFPLLAP